MARFVSFSPFNTTGTPGARGLTLDALMKRQADLAKSATQLPEAQDMRSPWQGAAYLGNVLGDKISQGRAANDITATRDALSKITAGMDYDAGPSSEQIAQVQQYDPVLAEKLLQTKLDRAKEQRGYTQAEQIQQSGFTHADTSREDSQQATVDAANVTNQRTVETENRNRDNYTEVPPEVAAARGWTPEQAAGFKYNTLTKDIEPIAGKGGITINNGETQTTLDKELGTQTGKLWSGFQAGAATSAGTVQDMEMLKQLLPMAPQGPVVGDIAKRFPGISSAGAAVQSIISRIAPTLRAPGSGATSDIEYEGMLRSLPNLGNMPEANALIAEMVQRKAQLNIERGRIVDQYQIDHDQQKAIAAMNVINSQTIMTPQLQDLIKKVGPAAAAAGDPEVDAIVKKYGG